MKTTTHPRRLLIPLLAGYFVFAFSDVAAPLAGQIAEYYPERAALVSFLPSMAFIWFLLFSAAAASLMGRIGRKGMAMGGYLLTVVGLLCPFAAEGARGLGWYFIGFGLVGLGNMALQVAINPMLSAIAPPHQMTRYMTLGQVFRNAALALFAPTMLLLAHLFEDWRMLFALYAIISIAAAYSLAVTRDLPQRRTEKPITMAGCFALLGRDGVWLGVAGIALFLISDVACGFLSAQLIEAPTALLTTTGYYGCRIAGSVLGVAALRRWSDLNYQRWNLLIALTAIVGLFFAGSQAVIYLLFAVVGFAFSTTFATFYSVTMRAAGKREDEAAGLLVMAISAGALSGPLCGIIIDWSGEARYATLLVAVCIAGMTLLIGRAERFETPSKSQPNDSAF